MKSVPLPPEVVPKFSGTLPKSSREVYFPLPPEERPRRRPVRVSEVNR